LYVTGQGIEQQVVEDIKNNALVNKAHKQNGKLTLELTDLSRSHEIIAQLVGAGVQIDEVRKETADLEDIFLQLVEEEKRGEE
jgi:hypothetical protein